MMTKTLFSTLLGITMLSASFLFIASPTHATAIDESTKILKQSSKKSGLNAEASPTAIVAGVINQVIGVLGVVAVALVVYAGGLWLTAAGNDTKVQTAKKIIVRTVIGTIIIGLAYAITAFIFSSLIGTPTRKVSKAFPQTHIASLR